MKSRSMPWSNLFLLTAVASAAAPLSRADEPIVVEGKPLTVTISATAEATGDAGSQSPRAVVVTDDTVDGNGAPAEAKAISIRLVGDGQGFVFQGNAPANTEGKKVPFIGVVTSPLGEQVRAQTTLPEDVGLSVDVVSPDSPASKAGLKAHDILAKYDDQLLCAAVQLSALVKRTGTGNKATLTVLRGGKEMPIEVTVGEHAAQATFKVEGVNIAMGQPGQPGGPRVVAGQPLAPEVLTWLQDLESKGGSLNNVVATVSRAERLAPPASAQPAPKQPDPAQPADRACEPQRPVTEPVGVDRRQRRRPRRTP
jgi:hypothetical protein